MCDELKWLDDDECGADASSETVRAVNDRVDFIRAMLEAGVSDSEAMALSQILNGRNEALSLISWARAKRMASRGFYRNAGHVIHS